ncbi:hypothetical protein HIM_01419 [Hirsutella minnesotensis 3608]|nr:hypothetical protein HIM_01419 [Hirsutella minnesotensis 3608]
MPSLSTLLAAAAAVYVARGDTIRITAQDTNTFNPDTITAKPGDILEFHFQAKNHSVVSGTYESPCSPLQLGNGFYSGYIPAERGEGGKLFRVAVNSRDPLPFYSSQGDECPKGMVGIINPNGTKNLQTYRIQASALSRSVSPGVAPYGGQLVENNDPSVQRNPDGTVKTSTGSVIAPLLSMALAVGLAALMA